MWLTIPGTSHRYVAHELLGLGAETPEASFKQWVQMDEPVDESRSFHFSFRKKLFLALIEERC